MPLALAELVDKHSLFDKNHNDRQQNDCVWHALTAIGNGPAWAFNFVYTTRKCRIRVPATNGGSQS
jgi:hypothetical protein